jgi:hypothetical protein
MDLDRVAHSRSFVRFQGAQIASDFWKQNDLKSHSG